MFYLHQSAKSTSNYMYIRFEFYTGILDAHNILE